ncbi:MAG: hypothetical protein MRERC_2c133 [Mycoplasmataceae bacterium RC_NB112A]|nr:MAG: hypothetical protein MRERC_2c133 [Mycoplasmataceae bacterium RC_NB112A]
MEGELDLRDFINLKKVLCSYIKPGWSKSTRRSSL